MAPMNRALAEAYVQRPDQHVADGGFAKLNDIEILAQAGVETFVPGPPPRDTTRDRHALRPDDAPEVADWRRRMATGEAKAIYKERAATAEWANAQARNRDLTRKDCDGGYSVCLADHHPKPANLQTPTLAANLKATPPSHLITTIQGSFISSRSVQIS